MSPKLIRFGLTLWFFCWIFSIEGVGAYEILEKAREHTSIKTPELAGRHDLKGSLPYLLLLSFYGDHGVYGISYGQMECISRSPYMGAAVMAEGGAYSVKKPLPYNEVESRLDAIKEKTKKDIWPWIFFNRFVQLQPGRGDKLRLGKGAVVYFTQINGIDIYNETGALSDFKQIFRNALKAARRLNAPGVVIDHEAYNDNRTYDVEYLASLYGQSADNISIRLQSIGADLAQIVDEEYPQAVLLFLSLPLHYSTTLIAKGLLEEGKRKGSTFKVVAGGEETLGYVPKSIGALKKKIIARERTFSGWMKEYSSSFYLGGTMAPSLKAGLREGWIKQRYEQSDISSIEDFENCFEILFRSYEYVWIYAAAAAKYDPFDSEGSALYNNAIQRALTRIFAKAGVAQ